MQVAAKLPNSKHTMCTSSTEKLLAINEAKSKVLKMETAATILFDVDEDLDLQAAALQSYLLTLESNTVNNGATGSGSFNCYTSTNNIIDSGASTTHFVTS